MIEVDLQQLQVVFLVLLGLIVGTLGLLVAYVVLAARRAGRSGRGRQARVEDPGAGPSPGALSARAGRVPVVTLLREGAGRTLQVEIDGTRYRRLAEIEDPDLKRQVVETAMDLVRFTGVLGAESIAPAAVDKTYSWREDLRQEIRAQGRQAPAQPAAENVEERFLNLLAEIGPAPTTEKPNLATALQQRRSAKTARPEPPRSVVDDIEAIVQRRILLNAALAGRELHVRQDLEGTVRFHFDGHDYAKLDDIPNMTACQLVKDAIQEWEDTA